MARETVTTTEAPRAIGPYSQGIRSGELLFVSGQVGIDPLTEEFAGPGIKAQTRQALKNLEAVLAAAGAGLGDVVKVTVFLNDIGHFRDFNEVYGSFFGDGPPARSTVEVSALPLGALVEIEAVARVK